MIIEINTIFLFMIICFKLLFFVKKQYKWDIIVPKVIGTNQRLPNRLLANYSLNQLILSADLSAEGRQVD